MSSTPRSVSIFGVTGSIGQSAADVVESDPGRFDVVCVTADKNVAGLAAAARRLKARAAVIAREDLYKELKDALAGADIEAAAGPRALDEASQTPVDVTLCAMAGFAGLGPLMNSLKHGRVVAIANKEPLVAAGPLVMEAAKKYGATLLPVDSEHNAIFQVFDFTRPQAVEKIILTASGGPFRDWSRAQMAQASVAEALAHPTWRMGRKISIDSATMMNKALEVIEAHYLFAMPAERIEVLVHPESVIHSMVEYSDGSVLAQLGASDMRTPIAHALAWPERMRTPGQRLDLQRMNTLRFAPVDTERFPAIPLAYECLRDGPHACLALNAANEVAVHNFLNGRIGFLDIVDYVRMGVAAASPRPLSDLAEIVEMDQSIRRLTQDAIARGRPAFSSPSKTVVTS